jgi:hypothetical protein
MTEPHVIRLGGPWEYEALARTRIAADGNRIASRENLPPVGRAHLPADWGAMLGSDFRGLVRYTRRFGLPTNLEPNDQVSLVIDGVDFLGSVRLNGTALGAVQGYNQPTAFEVRKLLAPRNVLLVEVELPAYELPSTGPARPGRESLPGGLIGEVRLEIRPRGSN